MLKFAWDVFRQRRLLAKVQRFVAEGRIPDAIALLEEHERKLAASGINDCSRLIGRAISLGHLGDLHQKVGNESRARTVCLAALNLCLACGDLPGVETYATNLFNMKRDDADGARWAATIKAAQTATGAGEFPAILNQYAAAFAAEGNHERRIACVRLAQDFACMVLGGLSSRRPDTVVDDLERHYANTEYSPGSVEERARPEGYREYWCTPARSTRGDMLSFQMLIAEGLSGYMQVDRDLDFWSASEAALRMQEVSPLDLGLREMAVMATRRSADYNLPQSWAAKKRVGAMSAEWNAEANPHIHPLAIPHRGAVTDLWAHYGMSRMALAQSRKYQVFTGYDIRESQRPATVHEPWHGGPGVYYSWRTITGWTRWPRRQESIALAAAATDANLLLFVSHRWEELSHPDPTGRQLLATKVSLALALAAALRIEHGAQTSSGLPEVVRRFLSAVMPGALTNPELRAWADRLAQTAHETSAEEELWRRMPALEQGAIAEHLDAIRSRVLVWYDYASMNQKPRSESEQREFQRELQVLNHIQAGASTVVMSTDEEYEHRAWCFLEFCGGIRKTIVEMTPSWGRSLSVSASLNRWAHISDQLIANIDTHGEASIESTDLRTTEAGDLAIVAALIGRLPLMGLVESDGSDLVGGSIPLPFRTGHWIVDSPRKAPVVTEQTVSSREDFGVLPGAADLERAVQTGAVAAELILGDPPSNLFREFFSNSA